MNVRIGMLAASLGLLFSSAALAADLTDAQIDSAFQVANRDGDGTVDLTEASRFGISQKTFALANPDNDGTLDEKEAMAAGITSNKVFKEANPDNDGTLDMAEYLTALTMQAEGSK